VATPIGRLPTLTFRGFAPYARIVPFALAGLSIVAGVESGGGAIEPTGPAAPEGTCDRPEDKSCGRAGSIGLCPSGFLKLVFKRLLMKPVPPVALLARDARKFFLAPGRFVDRVQHRLRGAIDLF
jgi:hypothetical protein